MDEGDFEHFGALRKPPPPRPAANPAANPAAKPVIGKKAWTLWAGIGALVGSFLLFVFHMLAKFEKVEAITNLFQKINPCVVYVLYTLMATLGVGFILVYNFYDKKNEKKTN